MEVDEEVMEPMSPTAHLFTSSSLSLTNLAILEIQKPIDDDHSISISLINQVFLPINPRFSSIMVVGNEGEKKWKKVKVNPIDHIKVPVFPTGMSVEYYDECFRDYLSNIAMEELPRTQPPWEIHIVKYPTKDAAGNIIFKLHHALGDGFSLMGALLSCLHRVDNPSMPLTFPSRKSEFQPKSTTAGWLGKALDLERRVKGLFHTAYDFGWSLLMTSLIHDDKSPIRSGEEGVEFRPIITSTTVFSIDQIKQIKNKLKVTINDVISGVIIFGTRLYMQETRKRSGEVKSTALVTFSTRAIGVYKSVDEMARPDSDAQWGNRFTFIHVPLPKLTQAELQNPLAFVKESQRLIKRQKNSVTVFLTAHLLNILTKLRGPEATAKYIHGSLKNTSMGISNLIGPVEQMALANHTVKGLYYVVAGVPRSLSITMISYAGELKIAMNMEKGFMDPKKFKSCIEYAFEAISKAALEI